MTRCGAILSLALACCGRQGAPIEAIDGYSEPELCREVEYRQFLAFQRPIPVDTVRAVLARHDASLASCGPQLACDNERKFLVQLRHRRWACWDFDPGAEPEFVDAGLYAVATPALCDDDDDWPSEACGPCSCTFQATSQ